MTLAFTEMKYLQQLSTYFIILLVLCFALPSISIGQELVYRPKNPAFGGSPLNYQWLMSSATQQNKHKESSRFGFDRDPLADFQESLQRQILSELTRNLVRDRFGDNFDLSQESSLEFGEFSINITPGADGVTIRIYNILTGEETNITIPNING